MSEIIDNSIGSLDNYANVFIILEYFIAAVEFENIFLRVMSFGGLERGFLRQTKMKTFFVEF